MISYGSTPATTSKLYTAGQRNKITRVIYKFRSKTLNFEDLSLHHASSQPNAVTCTKLVAGQQYCCLSCAQLSLPSQHAISCLVVKGPAVLNMLEKRPFGFLSMFKTMAVQVRLSPEKEEAGGHTVWNRIWRLAWLALDQSVSWSARSLIEILGLAM